MKTKFWLSLLTLANVVVNTQVAQAQTYQPTNRDPVSDNTLGTQVSGTGGNFDITGGVSKGQTLFHSFTDFSVPTNGQANFLNPVGNRDIITRVTGNLFSDINGLVNTNGANFFLINPNGIVFGTNAQLNVGKAFVGSTANSLDLVGGGQTITFGTNPNGDAPLLSVAPNVLFDVSRLNLGGGAGAISNFGSLFIPNLNQYIGLIGGNVNLNGGQITAPGGQVELGGLSAPGTVDLGADVNNLRAQFPTNVARGDVSLTNRAKVDVVGTGGGNIAINARNVEVLGASVVIGGILSGFGTPATVAGDVKVNATEDVRLADTSAISNQVEQSAVGKGGGVEINARNLSVTNGAELTASTRGQGDAGNIKITATDNVSFNDGVAFTTVGQGAVGNGGRIEINARNLSVTNEGQLQANTSGQGDAGNIKITATGDVLFNGRKDRFSSAALSSVEQGAVGNGGRIEINTRNLSVTNGGQLQALIRGQGDAGNIKITATGDVLFDGRGSAAFSTGQQGAVGNGGGVEISARNLSVTNGGQLQASNAEKGNAGNVFLNANKIVLNDGLIGLISVNSTGGDLIINTTEYLLLRNNSSIITTSTSTGAGGNSGNITINSPLVVALPGNNDIRANAIQGNGGNLNITSQGLLGIQFRPKGQDSPTTNDITANSVFGQQGTVNIDTPGVDPGRDSTELPNVTTDASNQISQVCSANTRENKLTVTGRGGLPPNANDPLTSDVVWQDARAATSQPVASATTNPAKLIPPAVGWVFDGKGKVTLVAAATSGQPMGTSFACPTATK